jgi:murein DD-endopeptidase MepM/ murein hydrolase activator NlpD
VVINGLALPIEGAAIPTDPSLLPNAPREFRAGWHEGIDFPARAGTPVHAVAAGTVVRVDRDFVDWDRATRDAALYDALQRGYTPAMTLDRIRGRQVWIDHGRGVVSRYAHLSAVADLAVGDVVEAGTIVGAVGSSGYPEGGPHLHLEIRVGTSYLGDRLAVASHSERRRLAVLNESWSERRLSLPWASFDATASRRGRSPGSRRRRAGATQV